MIVVTGATGQLGKGIVEQLVKRVPAGSITATSREPEKAKLPGVRVKQADYEQKDSLVRAFAGAAQVLFVSSNAAAQGGDPIAQHRTVIEAARMAGVKRLVYTSQIASNVMSEFAPARDHAITEVMLRDSGLAWTALRNGFYATSGILMAGDAWKSGVLSAPEDGSVSWTAHVDLAEAAAAILANEGSFDGPTPPLTGAEALDFAALARLGGEILGREIRRERITDEALNARLASLELPAKIIEIATSYYRASRAGEFAAVDGTLATLIGRGPMRMIDVMKEKLTPA